MKRGTENERLLADALSDGQPAFRDALLAQTLQHARRRQQWRQARHGVFTLLISLGALWFWLAPKESQRLRPVAVESPKPAFELVRTQPLAEGTIVVTVPLPAEQLVVSAPTIPVIETAFAFAGYSEINDDELLAILAPRHPLLISCGPGCKQIIFPDSELDNRLPVN